MCYMSLLVRLNAVFSIANIHEIIEIQTLNFKK